jgi:hypothetical protein
MYLDGQSSHIPAAMVSASSFGPIEGAAQGEAAQDANHDTALLQ